MESLNPSAISRRDIITDANIADIVNYSDSDGSEISEDQNNEDSAPIPPSVAMRKIWKCLLFSRNLVGGKRGKTEQQK
jgi:hypothetical protein